MLELENYLARARDARAAADAATLDNVRDQCLRAEEAWLSMARRIERLNVMQERNEAAKAAERARETLG
ncbi:hypothetical protein [Sphingomonas sp. HDW15A]|uniref:hypothetical protein n=1 Tax=Sphingomonas sp. HDW15A TaxID=2714942 RepID=UPI001F0F87B7|nr:hypothetical protein [Sphingomonas sp. HDW15A]